ncbi:MAG: divalent-cation tolerance protein CutA [Chlamydiales bacterium]|nr:divalent-cation tolerance protein CutA [Chlamydiales bacterium]
MRFIQIETTCNDLDKAKKMASLIIEGKLAACIHIIKDIESIYYWDNQICKDRENKILIKTTDSCFEKISSIIKGHCGYEIPEIIAIEIVHIDKQYGDWLKNYVDHNLAKEFDSYKEY